MTALRRAVLIFALLLVLPTSLLAQNHQLTNAQRVTLKTALLADATAVAMYNIGNLDGLAAYYNTVASPNFFVWRTNVGIDDIRDQITWANLTPADAPDGTQTWLNRATQAQAKQFNLQIILSSTTGTLNVSKSNIRAGLQDALTSLYTGAAGASQAAGWVNVRDNALARLATRLEKLLATGNGGTAQTAATMSFEGTILAAEFSDL